MPLLSPFIYWAQSEENVFLKVELKSVKEPNIDLDSNRLRFKGRGVGAKGQNNYEFHIDFILEINPEMSGFNVHENRVDITLMKEKKGWWPRLMLQPQKPAWLKIDFDRWQSEDVDEEEHDDKRDIRDIYPDIYDRLQQQERGYKKEDLKNVYLVIYNLFMFVGYLYVSSVLAVRFLRDGMDSVADTYNVVGGPFKFLQLLQFLEVMHSLFGYTKTNILTALLQVTGRNVILFGLIDVESRLQTKPVVFYLFLFWSTVEIIRYPYYISQLYKRDNKLLTWLRYTIWIPLYPLGFFCEAVVVFRGIIYFEETGKLSASLPNKWNFSFHYPTFLRIYLLIISFPVMYVLISHMYKARVKKLRKKIKKI